MEPPETHGETTVPPPILPLRSATAFLVVVALSLVLSATGATAAPDPAPTPSATASVDPPPGDLSPETAPVFLLPDRAGPPLAEPRIYDVSHPQCGGTLPGAVISGIVGVDGGRVRRPNPCLDLLITWAASGSRPKPAYYLNTANPGPLLSQFWPSGSASPRACAADYPANDTPDCAYDYGWNSAADSWARAVRAANQAGAGSPVASSWWLDVETGNTWQSLVAGGSPSAYANDTAALQGTVDFLRAQGVADVGVYSTRRQWAQITGGASLGGLPVWYAGTGSLEAALRHCGEGWSFTGGPVILVQHSVGDFDANERCSAN